MPPIKYIVRAGDTLKVNAAHSQRRLVTSTAGHSPPAKLLNSVMTTGNTPSALTLHYP
jgi:hypothetical protein